MRWEDLTAKQRSNPRELFNVIMTQIDNATANGETEEIEEEEISTTTVSVSVKDTDDNPIGNATVTLSNDDGEYTGNTGSQGGCNIKKVPYGEYTVTTIAEGYVDGEDNININSNETELNIILEVVGFNGETPAPMEEEGD